MTKYEYKVIETNSIQALQAEGQEGWMVVSYDYKRVLLMRPIQTGS